MMPLPEASNDDDDDDEDGSSSSSNNNINNNNQAKSSTFSTSSSSSSTSMMMLNPIVWCIILTETAERCAYYGFRAILVLWFTHGLQYTENQAVSLFAATTALAYASPMLGAIVADGGFGRYRTILWFGCLYWVGLCLLTLAAYSVGPTNNRIENNTTITEHDNNEPEQNSIMEPEQNSIVDDPQLVMARRFTFLGLLLACIGTGGIKPCVSAFGADQVALEGDDDDDNDTTDTTTISNQTGYTAVQLNEDLVPTPSSSSLEVDKARHSSTPSSSGLHRHPHYHHTEESSPTNPQTNSNRSSMAQLPAATNSSFSNDNTISRKEDRIQAFFAIFYIGINIGALLSFVFIPMVRAHWGFGAAFLIPTVFMTFALLVFWSQRHSYKHSIPSSSLSKMMRACLILLYQRLFHGSSTHPIITIEDHNIPTTVGTISTAGTSPPTPTNDTCDKDDNENVDAQEQEKRQIFQDASQCLHVLPIMLLLPMFWMLYDQQSSVWTFQASRMNLYGLEPEQINVLNTIEIILLVPLFDRVIYPWLKQTLGWKLLPLDKMKWGMFLASISFLASGMVEYSIQAQSQPNAVNVGWQIPQISILAIGEILLNVTGLEFAYAQAPPTAQALILALYCFMTTLGDGAGAILYSSVFVTMNVATAMMICAGLMLVNMVVFSCVTHFWKPFKKTTTHDAEILVQDLEPYRTAGARGVKVGTLELGKINHTTHID